MFFLDKYQEVEFLDCVVVLFLIFWVSFIMFSIVATPKPQWGITSHLSEWLLSTAYCFLKELTVNSENIVKQNSLWFIMFNATWRNNCKRVSIVGLVILYFQHILHVYLTYNFSCFPLTPLACPSKTHRMTAWCTTFLAGMSNTFSTTTWLLLLVSEHTLSVSA